MLMRMKIFSALDFFMRNHSKVVVVLIPELCSSLACVNLPFSFQKGENRFEFAFAFALLIGLVNSQESSQRRNKRERTYHLSEIFNPPNSPGQFLG